MTTTAIETEEFILNCSNPLARADGSWGLVTPNHLLRPVYGHQGGPRTDWILEIQFNASGLPRNQAIKVEAPVTVSMIAACLSERFGATITVVTARLA